jgi:protein-S-isoprenylcysteine O-methyltransferase Ste14
MDSFITYGYGLVILLAWLTFLIYWLVSSRGAKKTVQRNRSGWGIRLTIIVIAVTIAISGTHIPGYTVTPLIGWIGALLSVIGIGYAIYARRYLGRNWGMPMSVKENPELVTTGPYAHVRHPIYTGILLTMLGSLATAGLSWLLILVIYLVFFIYSAKKEEEMMAQTFPDTYPDYKERTKMLIPFIF